MNIQKTLKQETNSLIKVVLFGPESTGKTTLSSQLAAHYNTVWVPEFLREFAQNKWDNEQKVCAQQDIVNIAQGQIKLENKAAKSANNILICDTDLLETRVYAEAYFKGFNLSALDEAIEHNEYDLYFLTYIDTPWEADDLRDKPEQREQMFMQFENALITNEKKYVLLKGNESTRLKKAIECIDHLLKQKEI